MMLSGINNKKILLLCSIAITIALSLIVTFAFANSVSTASQQKTFSSCQEAVDAFVKALKENNTEQLMSIFGPDSNDLVYSGDEVADRLRRDKFLKAYEKQHKIEAEGDKMVIIVGPNDWPFPIPIIKQDGYFVFDTNSGEDEILNRRIGQNELYTIQTMLAIVDAEREYAMKIQDSNGIREYAQKFMSDPNRKNGLYWETKEGEKPSPLGPLVAKAKNEGYLTQKTSEEPQPYYGYFYRILTAQGENADGGAFDYIVEGKMIGGFAVIAYPAEYGSSGIMTFIVNYDGVVYQKDLGEDTEKEAQAVKLFDPDKTWTKVQ